MMYAILLEYCPIGCDLRVIKSHQWHHIRCPAESLKIQYYIHVSIIQSLIFKQRYQHLGNTWILPQTYTIHESCTVTYYTDSCLKKKKPLVWLSGVHVLYMYHLQRENTSLQFFELNNLYCCSTLTYTVMYIVGLQFTQTDI